MKKFTIGNHLTPYLVLTCILLAGILWVQSENRILPSKNTSAELQSPVVSVTRSNFTAPGIRAFSEIVERPLFIKGRKPPPPPVAASPMPVRISPLRLQLEGVVITPKASIAVVRDLGSRNVLHLTTGMKHQDWELTSLTETIATFKLGDQTQELTLKK